MRELRCPHSFVKASDGMTLVRVIHVAGVTHMVSWGKLFLLVKKL